MPTSYYLGLDLGQSADPSALAIIEEPLWVPEEAAVWTNGSPAELVSGWVAPATIAESKPTHGGTGPAQPVLALKHLHRYPLGTPYPDIVTHVGDLMDRWPLKDRCVLLVDKTGVGAPVCEMFVRAKLSPIAITITGGKEVHADGSEIHVPKRDLAMAVQVLLQNRRLVFAAGLPLIDVLKAELASFEVKITSTGNETYEAWRTGTHDDTVLACCLAVWYREWTHAQVATGFSMSYDTRIMATPSGPMDTRGFYDHYVRRTEGPQPKQVEDRRAWVRRLDRKKGIR